jgi:hypothetical protein
MKYYRKKPRSTESICIDKIQKGINSIQNGNREGASVDKDLDFFFKKLKDINEGMYEELYMKYSLVRLEAEKKELKESVSTRCISPSI